MVGVVSLDGVDLESLAGLVQVYLDGRALVDSVDGRVLVASQVGLGQE